MKMIRHFLSAVIVAISAVVMAQPAELVITQGKKETLSFRKSGNGYTARSASMTIDSTGKVRIPLQLGRERVQGKAEGIELEDTHAAGKTPL